MPKLPPTEQKCVDDTLSHLRNALYSVINALHSMDHTSTEEWPIFQNAAHNIVKTVYQLEDDVKGYECECKAHKDMDRAVAIGSTEQRKTKTKSKRQRSFGEN